MTPTASQRRSRTTRLAAAGPTAGRRRTPSSAARETYGGKLIGPLLEEELSNSAVAVLEAERRLKIFQRTHRPTARFVTGLLATNWHDSEQLVWPPIASSNVAPPLMPSKSMGMMGGAPAMTGGHTLESLDDIQGRCRRLSSRPRAVVAAGDGVDDAAVDYVGLYEFQTQQVWAHLV